VKPSLLFSSNDSLVVCSHLSGPCLGEGAILAKAFAAFHKWYNLNVAMWANNEILGSQYYFKCIPTLQRSYCIQKGRGKLLGIGLSDNFFDLFVLLT
jgi:hypothetical protein